MVQKEKEIKSRGFAGSSADPTAAFNEAALSSTEASGRDLGDAIVNLPILLAGGKGLGLKHGQHIDYNRPHLKEDYTLSYDEWRSLCGKAHTNILNALMTKIKERDQPSFFELEQVILSANGRPDRVAILSMLRDSKGNHQDKARLLCLVAATNDASQNSKANNDELDAAFVAGCNAISPASTQAAIDKSLAAVTFLRRMQSLSSPLSGMGGGGAGANAAIFSSIFNNAVAKATQMFAKFTPYYVTRVVDNLAEGRSCAEASAFTYFDPRTARDAGMPDSAAGHKYSDVIVFVVGGGSYAEFFNLQELLKGKASGANALRSIMYGTSDLLSGGDFLDQLERLGAPSAVTVAK